MGFKMNIYIGWLFKLIPLLMGIICIALGEGKVNISLQGMF